MYVTGMGPASLTSTGQSTAFSRRIYFPYKSSPFRRMIRGGILCAAKSKSAAPSCSEEMVKAIRVHELGGAEVLKWEDVEVGDPKEGEIRVRHKAIGVNFIDVYFRKGVYKAPSLPFIPGMEAVGEVVAVGPGPTGRNVGDIVAYAGQPMGSYAEERILPASKAIPVPSSLDPVVVASALLKGMTTQFLVRRCFKGYDKVTVCKCLFSSGIYLHSVMIFSSPGAGLRILRNKHINLLERQ